MRRRSAIVLTSLFCILLFATAAASQDVLVRIDRMYPEEVDVAGFRLTKNQDIEIEATGLFEREHRREFILGYAWILNSKTREVVWDLMTSAYETESSDLKTFNGQISLPKGEYEVYYSSYPYYRWNDEERYWSRRWDRDGWRGWMSRIFDGDWYRDRYYYDDVMDDFKVVIRGDGEKIDDDEMERNQEAFRNGAILSLPITRDDRYETNGFILKKPMELTIYAIGEARHDGNFDYTVIVDTKDLQRVWELSYRDSEHAGGAHKNRMKRETVSLPAGRYVAYTISDGSHSPWEWNAPPPYDPAFWGLTIHAKNADMRNEVELYDYDGYELENAIVEFSRVRDDEFLSKGFTLKKPMTVRIYALGEGRDGDMFDYGWLVDAKTHERVWEMDFYDTDHAGGGHKNRLFDKELELDKGSYIAYYVTDGSHSYRDWNTSPPFDQERWGLTLLATDDDFNRDDVTDYVEEEDKSILAKMVRMRDYDRDREEFTLEKDSKIRIYALGEGRRGRMYDTAWIEEVESGDVVWEMGYRMTEHAGGSDKNRMFNDVISLKKGRYYVYYETDDSHSFNDWNASPPYDPENWGVTVYLVE